MDNRVAALGLAAIAVAAVATTSQRAVAPAPAELGATAAAQKEPPSPPPASGSRGADLLHAFFGSHWPATSTAAPDTFAVGSAIATLPDPYDSHLDWSFDAQLEAIRRAFETSDYVLDRFWLPGRDSIPGKDTVAARVLREFRPGAMLFRRTSPGRRRLVVLYVVPELPTRGVYKEALRAALEDRHALLEHVDLPVRPDRTEPIRIIGPTFSGSALSLQFALRGWLASHPTDSVEIVSGSATSPTNLETLNRPDLRMHFSATINPDVSLTRAFSTVVLPKLGLGPSQVALLRESSTQYGQNLLDTDSASGSTADSGQFVIIPFPMSISSLRAEYQRVPRGNAAPASPPLPGAEAPRLPLDLLDPTRPKEDLPVTSRLSPLALDLILDDLARTLVRRQIRLVGLLATDVRDKLFLGDEIRKRVRDVQFFTYQSNILYLRPDRSLALRGMLVLSTYPLILENQWSTSSDRSGQRFAFGSDGAEGVYNATLLQLGSNMALVDYRRTRDTVLYRPPVWLSTVGNETFLPVTVVVDSLDTAYVAPSCRRGEGCPKPGEWPAVRLPFLPLATMLLTSFALMLLSLSNLVDDRKVRTLLKTRGVTEEFERRPLAEQVMVGSLKLHDRLYRMLRIVAAIGIFLAAWAPVGLLIWRGLSRPGSSIYLLLFGIGTGATVLSVVALVSCGLTMLEIGRRIARPGWQFFLAGPPWTEPGEQWSWRLEVAARTTVAVFGIIYLVLVAWFTIQVLTLHGGSYWLFFRRAVEVDSLVSPVLPLILGGIGYFVWCTWHIERIALLQNYTTFEGACEAEFGSQWVPRPTVRSALREDFRRSGGIARTIRSRLFQVVPSPAAFGLLAVFACLAWWLAPQFGRSLEAILIGSRGASLTAFDVLFRVTVIASMFATAWGALRLVVVWAGLRQCLAGFGRMPLVTAFDRLPPRLSRLTRLTLPRTAPRSGGAVADLQWLHLQRIHAATQVEFGTKLSELDASLAPRVERLMAETPTQASILDWRGRTDLIARLIALHELLRELWRLEPMPDDVAALTQSLLKEFDRPDPTGAPAVSTTVRVRRGFAGPVRLWLRAAEEYVASRMVEYIEWVIRHLRVLALFMLLSLVLTTLLVSSYPYHPQSLLRLILLLVMVFTVGAFVAVLVQMNRNEVLSRIAHTEPGEVTWNASFILNLFTFGVVPLLTLLSSEFPELRNALFAWVQPLVNALVKQ
jgi:hypothetical protein